MRELEVAAADSLGPLIKAPPHGAPTPGALCLNCQASLQGPYCHVCGQAADIHKRSIGRLIVETVEGIFHLDGRLRRTLPDLFFRPGGLARDYMEGRIARHVPPFRTFLVALLLFIFAAEYATHQLTAQNDAQARARTAALATPQGRAAEVMQMRAEAFRDRNADLAEARSDLQDAVKDPDENRAVAQAQFLKKSGRVQTRFLAKMAEADRISRGLPPRPKSEVTGSSNLKGFKEALHKATTNPEYYLAVLFTWGHRAAILLLPITGLALAAAYFTKRRYFIYDHLLVAMDFLAFVFLANALALVLPAPLMGWALGLVALWTPINLFQTLRGAYGSSVIGAVIKTLFVWSTASFAFLVLMVGLLVFTLFQL